MLNRIGLRRTVVATATAIAAITITALSATSASAAPRTAYPGSVPAWATPAADQGATADDTSVEGEVYLPLRNQAGAERLASLVSSPANPFFRQGVSSAQWISQFSPTVADYNGVVSWLKNQGFTITATPKSRLFVVYRAPAAAQNAAFGTQLHNYAHDATTLVAPSSAPSVPAELAGKIQAISMDQSRLLAHPTSIRQGAGLDASVSSLARSRSAAPAAGTGAGNQKAECSNYYGEKTATRPAAYGTTTFPTFICGYTPAQLRSAYGVQSLVSRGIAGQGQTIAITDAYDSPTMVSDVNTYSAALGEPLLRAGQYRSLSPAPSQFVDKDLCLGDDPSGWQGEQTLDVEAVHGIAPAANILYVGGFNCGGGLDAALATILDGKLANIVTNSWGDVGEDLPLDVLQGESNLFIQAAGEGIGMYFSSGDNGDEVAALGTPEPDFPASSPWVTAVGGTSIGIAKNGSLLGETGWGSAVTKVSPDGSSYLWGIPGEFSGGAGGGTSTIFPQPAYQKGIVPSSLAKGMRVSPDVAALADPYTGFLIGISPISDFDMVTTAPFENETYGGTSLASPLTAAMVAVQQQALHTQVGFANPTLYAIAKAAPGAIRDVAPYGQTLGLAYTSASSGNNYLVTLDQDTSLTTAKGYDDVTGLGGISFALIGRLVQGR